MSGDSFDMELATAGILANTSDVRLLLRLLARQLEDTLGSRVRVERDGRLLRRRRPDDVRSIRVFLGGEDYGAELTNNGVVCSIGHDSGGIRIRTEKVGLEEWLSRLLQRLQAEAEHNQNTRMALQNLLLGNQP